jgi:hypothetical protein
MCGVGITFVEDNNGALYVKSLVPGGSSARSGSVQVLHSTPPRERDREGEGEGGREEE